jgi:hypothetical protein
LFRLLGPFPGDPISGPLLVNAAGFPAGFTDALIEEFTEVLLFTLALLNKRRAEELMLF